MLKDKIVFGTKETFDGEDIAFSHVDFGYGDKSVFKDFNLNLDGEKPTPSSARRDRGNPPSPNCFPDFIKSTAATF